jgi:hypothetical protein
LAFDILLCQKAEDSNPSTFRRKEKRLRFAVHRLGIPEASPRSHRMPCGDIHSGVHVLLTNTLSMTTDISGEEKRRVFSCVKSQVATPRSL